jgi:hypothetical protein
MGRGREGFLPPFVFQFFVDRKINPWKHEEWSSQGFHGWYQKIIGADMRN